MRKLKHDYQIKELFDELFDASEVATQDAVDEVCRQVLDEAVDQFGTEGVYVSGILNADMQGVSFRFKRPGIGQRIEHFIACEVPKPQHDEDSQNDEPPVVEEDDDKDNDDDDSGSPQDEGDSDRLMILEAAALNLSDEDFMGDGRPHVDKINDHLEEGVEPFTAAERDELWAQRAGE